MAEKSKSKQKKGLLGRLGLDGGIRRRWFINNMSVVILILLLAVNRRTNLEELR